MSRKSVAIIGATGAVGAEMLGCLERRNFVVTDLKLLASANSAGRSLSFRGQDVPVETLDASSFGGVDLALFAAGGEVSRAYAALARSAGAIVIDNSSAFRMDADVPLVIPEINSASLAHHRGLIANPNCSTIIAMTPLWAIHCHNPIRRLICTTYQSASGAGAAGMRELADATRANLEGRDHVPQVFPYPYAFNLFSHNSPLDVISGYNEEELKMVRESRKIFAEPTLRVSATCVRVPVLRAHTIALTFECERPIDPEEVRGVLVGAPGVLLVDDRQRNHFPTPQLASERDEILVGRVRHDLSDPGGHSISLLVAGDQLRKGAALNAIQIAEML